MRAWPAFPPRTAHTTNPPNASPSWSCARCWSLAETARRFQITPATISSWSQRLDEEGPDALLQMPEPVNKFPDFVRRMVRRLKTLCPHMGKVKIVANPGPSRPAPGRHYRRPHPQGTAGHRTRSLRRWRRRQDLGSRLPREMHQDDLPSIRNPKSEIRNSCAGFCWWVAVVIDHYSRKALGFAVFKQQPTSLQVREFLGRLIAKVGQAPKYLVTDSGVQFTCAVAPWCKRHKIKHRKGAVGQTGSIAVCERFILTIKDGCTRLLSSVPMVQRSMRQLSLFFDWYNQAGPT